jgi:site-specific DNA recombinase
VFQQMIARIKAKRDVDYVLVYNFNRIFRNSVDAAIVKRDLKKLGVRVVSCVVDLGEGPEAVMVESIMHAVDQYQSEASGADIKFKMGEKAKHGGTLGRAKLGYRNVILKTDDGRVIRTVELDHEGDRAAHVTRAFELYATGQYTGKQLVNILTQAGLRTRGDRRTSSRPLSTTGLYNLLADRYYLGKVAYQGVEYPGRHQALTTHDVFQKVQSVLVERGGGVKDRTHNHYLKGLLWCASCGRRVILTNGRGNGGKYFYWLCLGRQSRACDLPYLSVDKVGRAVEAHYATVRLDAQLEGALRGQLAEVLLSEDSSMTELRRQLRGRLTELDEQEERFLDLVGRPGWPQAKIQTRLTKLEAERAEIQGQLTQTVSKLKDGQVFVETALQLLDNPQAFYQRAGTSLRRSMNALIFTKLYLDADGVARHDLTDTARPFVEANRAYRQQATKAAAPARRNNKSSLAKEGAFDGQVTEAELLILALSGQGSRKPAMVELRGLEPLTPSLPVRCATSCAIAPKRR